MSKEEKNSEEQLRGTGNQQLVNTDTVPEVQQGGTLGQNAHSKTETGNMEIHHHPNAEKKNFKEYLLEGVMIFVAVTMGFIAENVREYLSDKEKAETFARSMYADFKADTATLNQLIFFTKSKIQKIDSLEYYLHLPTNRGNDSLLYRCALYLTSTFQFDNINGTYEQIKSSGALRYFNQQLVNHLNSYDATAQKLKLMEDLENKFLFERVIPQSQEMFNYKVFSDMRDDKHISHDMYIRKIDSQSIGVLVNEGEVIKRLRQRQLNQQMILLQNAGLILADLEKEFKAGRE